MDGQMTSSKPYILRALYEWIVDNECTPYMLVAAELPGVQVPEDFVEDGQVVLNLAPSAVRALVMNNEVISFEARFSGVPHQILVPLQAIMALYARENGQGMYFEPEQVEEPALDIAESNEGNEVNESEEPPLRPKGPPSLRVVK